MAKILAFLSVFFLFQLTRSQVLNLDELTFYLNPENLSTDSLITKKGFKLIGMSVISSQSKMYAYSNKEFNETFYFGGIDEYSNYRIFHLSYFFDSVAYTNFLSYFQTMVFAIMVFNGIPRESLRTIKYSFYLYPKDLLKIFSKEKYPLAKKCALDGVYDEKRKYIQRTDRQLFFRHFRCKRFGYHEK
ncbi:MAG: hypothetical protein HC906_14740 [Bacteroidales bacterium]|nr:hypothetical protein [Bacteroidales bacterium]